MGRRAKKAGQGGAVVPRRAIRLAVSVLCGAAAALLTFSYVSDVRAEATRELTEARERYGGELAEVCVSTREIEPGEQIDESSVRVEDWISTLLPEGAVSSLRESVGKTATSRIPEGAPICAAYFVTQKNSYEVPKGKVAVSVPSDEKHSVGGLLARGDEVEVYVSKASVADRICVATVLDSSVLADGGELTWVTLAVDPESTSELLAASSQGMVTLTVPGVGSDE